ncbi:MAG: hypothetical protein ABIN99_00995 [Nitrosospira sp.]
MEPIKFEDVQGFVFSGYNKVMKYSSYYLLKIHDTDKVRLWLKTLTDEQRITTGKHRGTTWCLNLAFSFQGFKKLGVIKDSNEPFEQAFRDGMYSPRRSVILDDQGDSHPDRWEWGNTNESIDILLLLFSRDEATHEERKNIELTSFAGGGLLLIKRLDAVPPVNMGKFTKEHFGFADGISNLDLMVEGFPKTPVTRISTNPQALQTIPAGEFLLGYPNGYDGKLTAIPGAGSLGNEFGINGTYLVFRQLQQDVKGFWSFIDKEANAQGINREYLAAKFVGRWKNGAVVSPDETSAPNVISNNFDFSDDPNGIGCPFGSHIRRTNPRGIGLGETIGDSLKVANRHRLLRRGRSYGTFLDNPLDDGDNKNRGLFFICLNANIERQFEFVQRTWINGIKFNGLYDEDEPITGSYGLNQPNFIRSFTLQDKLLRQRVCNFPRFVNLKGGGYFFLPGIKALRMLASDGVA